MTEECTVYIVSYCIVQRYKLELINTTCISTLERKPKFDVFSKCYKCIWGEMRIVHTPW